MPFPKTLSELTAAGYTFLEHARCRGPQCRREIEWWQTTAGKKIPLELMERPDALTKPHWADCPDADSFRRKKA
jgi:hypothetical protein